MLRKIRHFPFVLVVVLSQLGMIPVSAQTGMSREAETELYKLESESPYVTYFEAPRDQMDFKNGVYQVQYNGEVVIDGAYEDNLRSGSWKFFHQNGNLSAKGIFANNVQYGEWDYYYANGNLSANGRYRNGEKTGLWTGYYPTGKPAAIIDFINDTLYRSLTYYSEQGSVLLERDCRLEGSRLWCDETVYNSDGLPLQSLRAYLDLDQQEHMGRVQQCGGLAMILCLQPIMSSFAFTENLWALDGPFKLWHSSGTLAVHAIFVDNRLDATYAMQDIWGNPVEGGGVVDGEGMLLIEGANQRINLRFPIHKGVPDGRCTLYHDNGKTAFEGKFKEGRPDSVWAFYEENAQPHSTWFFDRENTLGIPVTYTTDAQSTTVSGHVLNGYRNGRWTAIDYAGDTLSIHSYDRSFRQGLQVEFDLGQRRRQGAEFLNQPVDEWITRNKNGRISWRGTYASKPTEGVVQLPWVAPVPVLNPLYNWPNLSLQDVRDYQDQKLAVRDNPWFIPRQHPDSAHVLLAIETTDTGTLSSIDVLRDIQGKGIHCAQFLSLNNLQYKPFKIMGIPMRKRYYIEFELE
ncbi:MAG: toxin-antitoxin system YwqK family antitoxin [Flavobacteriales bacterium]|nr:toxin-antitoxin system YwqK family antitoxin [Flavobacteriales bacterium]